MSDITQNDIIKTQSLVAEHVLKSDKGWEVLNQLYLQASRQFMATRAFTLPVLNRIDELKEKLSDPVGFQKSFHTLLHDLSYFQQLLMDVQRKHVGRTGEPKEFEWPILFEVSQDYNNLLTHFDTVINPLMMDLIKVIEQEHGNMIDNRSI